MSEPGPASTLPLGGPDAFARKPRDPGRWRFWGTLAWGFAIVAAWIAAQFVLMVALLVWESGPDIDLASAERLFRSGSSIAIVAIGAAPAVLAVLALAVALSGHSFRDYLGLVAPRAADWIIGLVCLVVLLPGADLLTHLSGREVTPKVVLEAYRTARDSGALPWLAIALVVIAPLTEELTFRGFLYRGWAASPLGPAGAIALTSLLWAGMHLQYDLFFIAQIFALGLVLGWLRQRSGSTLLTMGLHGLVNLWALVQSALMVGRLSGS